MTSRHALLALALLACNRDKQDQKEPPRDPEHPRRVIEPSTDKMRPLPPHAIRADGIGPYKLGEKLSDLTDQLPTGPRIAVFEIPGLVHWNVIRAEDDAILVGGEQGESAAFAAVVEPEVARTESGIHVGSTREALVRALGPLLDEPDRATDPRLAIPSALPNARAVFDGDRVAALVVAVEAPRRAFPAASSGDCARPPAAPKSFGACLTPGGERVEVDGDELTVRSVDGERVLGTARVPGLLFAAPLRNPNDNKDELAVVSRVDDTARSWLLSLYRIDGPRFVRSLDPSPLYQVTPGTARWIGAADPSAIELDLELWARADTIEVGGLLVARAGEKLRDVVVVSPVSVARKRAKAAGSNAGQGSAPAALDAPDADAPHDAEPPKP